MDMPCGTEAEPPECDISGDVTRQVLWELVAVATVYAPSEDLKRTLACTHRLINIESTLILRYNVESGLILC